MQNPHIEDEEKKLESDHIESVNHNNINVIDQDMIDRAQDDAASILREVGAIEWTIKEERAVLRKIDFWVCIPMLIVYLLTHLDKNAVAYGAVFGLQASTGLVGTQYSWLTSCIYLAQLVFQPLTAYALVKLPFGKWVIFNVLCWGICTAFMGLAKNFTGLIITRVLVGAFEACVSPAFIAVVQTFWRRREQTYRNTFWLLSSAIAGVIGPLIAYGVGKINDGLEPYQGIFIFLGCITIALVPLLYYMMPDSIQTARFLDTREKAIAIERLRSNNTGTKTSKWKNEQVVEALLDPKTWGWGFMLLFLAIPSSGIGAFGGLITKGFGFDAFTTILFQIPIAVLQGLVLVSMTFIIAHVKIRSLLIAPMVLVPMGGALGLLLINRSTTNPHLLLVPYYMVLIYSPIQPLAYSWANQNCAGSTKQRTTSAIMFIMQSAGNVVGPQVYLTAESPLYHTGLYTDLACWSCFFITALGMGAYMRYLNNQQEKRRRAAGRVAHVKDTSIMTLEEAEEYNKMLAQEAHAVGEIVNAHAFEDLTDRVNIDFAYVW